MSRPIPPSFEKVAVDVRMSGASRGGELQLGIFFPHSGTALLRPRVVRWGSCLALSVAEFKGPASWKPALQNRTNIAPR